MDEKESMIMISNNLYILLKLDTNAILRAHALISVLWLS